jgi:hypothetical protein
MVVWDLNSPLIQNFAKLSGQLLEREWFSDKVSCPHFNGFFCGRVSGQPGSYKDFRLLIYS